MTVPEPAAADFWQRLRDNYVLVFQRSFDFSGRAGRAEFWLFFLANLGVLIVLSVLSHVVGLFMVLQFLYGLVTLLPGLAVTVRRLHDTNRSAWWLLLWFVPLIGAVALVLICLLESDPGPNAFGPNPEGMDAGAPPESPAF